MERIIQELIKNANQGDIHAQLELGYCYTNGEGIEQNKEEGIRWFKEVEKQGTAINQFDIVAEAQHNIASCIILTLINKEDYEKDSIKYLELEKKENEAIEYLKKAADNGYKQSQYAIGVFYENGIRVEIDHSKVIEYSRYKK